MLNAASDLKHFVLDARDGEIGRVRDFLFDDQSLTIRYLEIDTHKWLPGRRVLISPLSASSPDIGAKRIPVDLSKHQIERAPGIDTDRTVSRDYERRYNQYFNYPPYWIGVGLSSGVAHPAPLTTRIDRPKPPSDADEENHLRSVDEISGYGIAAADGELGRVRDCVIDTHDWVVRYLAIDVRKWLPGPTVLLPTQWIERVSWLERSVTVDVLREQIRSAKRFELPMSREQEAELFTHYSKAPYWNE